MLNNQIVEVQLNNDTFIFYSEYRAVVHSSDRVSYTHITRPENFELEEAPFDLKKL